MTTTAPRTTPTGRLGNGELRRQVAAWLDEHPGPHTPGTDRQGAGPQRRRRRQRPENPGRPGRGRAPIRQARPLPGHPRHQGGSRRHVHRAGAQARHLAQACPRAGPPPLPPTPAPPPSGVTRPNGAIYRPRALADMPDVDALRKLRAAGHPRPAVRAARHRQDLPGRGRLRRRGHHGRRRRRHRRRRPGRRLHPARRRHLRVHLRTPDHRHDRGQGPVHRRRHPDQPGGARGDLPRHGRPRARSRSRPTKARRSPPPPASTSSAGTTPTSTARS